MISLPEDIKKFMAVFEKKGFQIYLVGGAVRNLLLNKEITNWDFTTDATPEKMLNMFPHAFYNNIYGTVCISVEAGHAPSLHKYIFEITPFRKESDYGDNRHPMTIEWAKTVEEDLARRDFSINAIAFDGKKIIDPFSGQKHLKEKMIVAVGDPDKRFKEDALRLMRGVRLAAQLGFLIEEKTRSSIQRNAHLIKNISWERIRDELLKIIESEHPDEGILFLHSTGLLNFILPELEICFSIPQKSPNRHHIYDVGTHSVMALKHCSSPDPITRLATLLHDIGKTKTFWKDKETELITFHNHEVVGTIQVTEIAKRLKLSKLQSEKLIRLVKYHQFTVSEEITDKAVRRFIREVGKEYLQDMLDLRTADRIGSGATPTSWRYELFKKRVIEVQKEPFKVSDLKVDGHDVMKIFNIKPSKQIGDILDKLFEDVVEGKLKNDREALLARLSSLPHALGK